MQWFGGDQQALWVIHRPGASPGLEQCRNDDSQCPKSLPKTEPMGRVKPPLKAASAPASSGRLSRHCCASSPEKQEPTVYVVDWLFHMKDKLPLFTWKGVQVRSHTATSNDTDGWLPPVLYLYCLCHPKAFCEHGAKPPFFFSLAVSFLHPSLPVLPGSHAAHGNPHPPLTMTRAGVPCQQSLLAQLQTS